MRKASKERQEQLVLVFAALLILVGGYVGSGSGFGINTFLGAMLAAVIIMGWIVASTVAGCLESIQVTLLELRDRMDTINETIDMVQKYSGR